MNLSLALRGLGDYPEAERRLRQSLELLEGAWGEDHLDVLAAKGDLAGLRHLRGDVEAAEAEQRRVLAAKREHLGERHPEVALTLVALAEQLRDQGDFPQSEELLRQALELRRDVLVAGHPDIGRTMLSLAETLRLADRAEDAVAVAEEGLLQLGAALPEDHPQLEEGRRVLESCRSAAARQPPL